jgi:hypothetical protein
MVERSIVKRSVERFMVLVSVALIAGCTLPSLPRWPAPPPPPSAPVVVPPAAATVPTGPAAPASARARSWNEYRMQAARRMVQLNPTRTYMSTPPEPLMAIPVLEVELNADGSVANIRVERVPREVTDTVQVAIDAVRRSAPYGSVAHLPKPWKFTEVFLFDYEWRFKPRSLD